MPFLPFHTGRLEHYENGDLSQMDGFLAYQSPPSAARASSAEKQEDPWNRTPGSLGSWIWVTVMSCWSRPRPPQTDTKQGVRTVIWHEAGTR